MWPPPDRGSEEGVVTGGSDRLGMNKDLGPGPPAPERTEVLLDGHRGKKRTSLSSMGLFASEDQNYPAECS